MADHDRFNERYKTGNIPWDLNRPDNNLIEMVTGLPVQPCHVLDVGCGTGDNAIWLASQGFEVTGCDCSETAIELAQKKALEKKVQCDFCVADFLSEAVTGCPFQFVFDRGCFHSFDEENERRKFAKVVDAYLVEDGMWLSLIGNADDPRQGEEGPPQRSVLDIAKAVEPEFEILSLTTSVFDSDESQPYRAWACLMHKRG